MPMLSPDLMPLVVFALAALSAGAALYAAFYPRVAGDRDFERRLEAVGRLQKPSTRGGNADESRKRSVEATLRELEEKQKAKAKKRGKPTFVGRMRQAGLAWSKTTYYLVGAVAGAMSFFVATTLFGIGLVPALGFGAAGGLLLPHLYVGLKRARRFKAFAAEFPNALDVIVRGVKSGLPLVDCLKIIATESQEPVKREFQSIVEDQTLGVPLDEAVERLAERVPIAEASFFAIVLAIQSRTGGSLSGALGNLSHVLRDRKKMKAKIKAMSQEAKSSAGIIGALPVAVAGILYFVAPDYVTLLLTETLGNIVLVGCGLWMLMGILVMRKMINFDF
jgi:tight adherence protein B